MVKVTALLVPPAVSVAEPALKLQVVPPEGQTVLLKVTVPAKLPKEVKPTVYEVVPPWLTEVEIGVKETLKPFTITVPMLCNPLSQVLLLVPETVPLW
jgi:hypothetical protein